MCIAGYCLHFSFKVASQDLADSWNGNQLPIYFYQLAMAQQQVEKILIINSLPCYLVPSSRGRLLVISMTISLQASRSLVSPHSSVSVEFGMALMSSSHRARGLPLFLAPPPIPNIIDFSKLFSLRMMCPKYDSCCFFISASSGLVNSMRQKKL